MLTIMACFRLELREASCISVDPGLYEDNEPSGYDYDNDHDTSEYCPNVALVSTVKSVVKPLYLLAASYSFTVMQWLILMLSFLGSPLFMIYHGFIVSIQGVLGWHFRTYCHLLLLLT